MECNRKKTLLNHLRINTESNPASVRTICMKPVVGKPVATEKFGKTKGHLVLEPPATQLGWLPDKENRWILSNNNQTVRRVPQAACHDVIRGAQGASDGTHVWTIKWDVLERGNMPVVGVAEASAPCIGAEYHQYPRAGADKQSWVWHMKENALLQSGHPFDKKFPAYPGIEFRDRKGHYAHTNEISIILDMDAGTLDFANRDGGLGTAFSGLKGKTLYPIVGTGWAQAKIHLEYRGKLVQTPKKLYNMIAYKYKRDYKELKKHLALPDDC